MTAEIIKFLEEIEKRLFFIGNVRHSIEDDTSRSSLLFMIGFQCARIEAVIERLHAEIVRLKKEASNG